MLLTGFVLGLPETAPEINIWIQTGDWGHADNSRWEGNRVRRWSTKGMWLSQLSWQVLKLNSLYLQPGTLYSRSSCGSRCKRCRASARRYEAWGRGGTKNKPVLQPRALEVLSSQYAVKGSGFTYCPIIRTSSETQRTHKSLGFPLDLIPLICSSLSTAVEQWQQ